MTNRYPSRVDARRLAKQSVSDRLRLDLAAFPRLAEMEGAVESALDVELNYRTDASTHSYLEVAMTGRVAVPCQRCLRPVSIDIDVAEQFVVVSGDDDDAPSGYEPAVQRHDGLNVPELLEDELLLQLPHSPLHDANECSLGWSDSADENSEEASVEPEARSNPFAVLKGLKDDS